MRRIEILRRIFLIKIYNLKHGYLQRPHAPPPSFLTAATASWTFWVASPTDAASITCPP